MRPLRGFLLDTNVVSESQKSRPSGELLHWLRAVEPSALYLSVLTLGELRKGVAIKQRIDPHSADKLRGWVDGLEYGYADRILNVDAATASIWGELSTDRTRPPVDTLLAATAIAHELAFVTRNVQDVRGIDVQVINPWAKL